LVSILATLATTQRASAGAGVGGAGVLVARSCILHGSAWASGNLTQLPEVHRITFCYRGTYPVDYVLDTYAYAEAGFTGALLKFPYVRTYTRVSPPTAWGSGFSAWAWGWADPSGIANNIIYLEKGITLIQNGSARAFYQIEMVDMNTTDHYTYWARLEDGFFTASSNWSTDWTQIATGFYCLPPMNITVDAMPADHAGNCTHQAEATSYNEYSLAIANSTEGPSPVGGVQIPIDKLSLLTPSIGIAATVLTAVAATAFCTRRFKRRKEKQ